MPGIHPVLQAMIALGIEQDGMSQIQLAAFFSKLLGWVVSPWANSVSNFVFRFSAATRVGCVMTRDRTS